MDSSKNKDIFKLISEILEYTEDPTTSDHPGESNGPPECRCKEEGGSCGDYPPIDCPGELFPTRVLCFCESNPLKSCPKCPPKTPCVCKNDGGDCGDDTSTCEPLPNGTYPTTECLDGTGLICNICPICPPITPTPTRTPCSCSGCGYYNFQTGGCQAVCCGCYDADGDNDCDPNYNCYDCPTAPPTETVNCDNIFCECDTGSNCKYCTMPGYECTEKQIKVCALDCYITCGQCVPVPTETPTPTTTETPYCPCDCSDFKSLKECQEWLRRFGTGNNTCDPVVCSDKEGCMTNITDCYNIGLGKTPTPPPTFTPTSTCIRDCTECGLYPFNGFCEGCHKQANDFCLQCLSENCVNPPCPSFPCKECFHQPKICTSGEGGLKFSNKDDCEAYISSTQSQGELTCDSCGMFQQCTEGLVYEQCFCINPVPTESPTKTICECKDFGDSYAEEGECGERGLCFHITRSCPDNPEQVIACDLCCTPTPTNPCECKTCAYYSDPDSCKGVRDTYNKLGYRCYCKDNVTCTCSQQPPYGENTGCSELICETIPPTPTPTPTETPPPTPTPTCKPPDGCCTDAMYLTNYCNILSSVGCQQCVGGLKWTKRKNPDDPRGCPEYTCYSAHVTGVGETKKPIGERSVNNGIEICKFYGLYCTVGGASCAKRDVQYYTYQRSTLEVDLGVC